MSEKVSVLICAYNYARFVPQCLESVVSQSRPADEIILIDDGSTDDTPDVVKRFPQVRYIRQENAGKAVAFNRGFRESQGEVICHLDADDYWMPEKIARVTATLARADAGGVLHDAFYVDAQDQFLYGSEKSHADASERRLSFHDVLLMCFIYRPANAISGSLGVANTICVRREAVADCFPLPADLGLAVDGALLLGAARRGLIRLSDKLSVYRHHGQNAFVSTPASLEFQARLFNWVATIPGVTDKKDRKLLQTLSLESAAHASVNNGNGRVKGAFGAALIVPKLVELGLVPHWKHFGLPLAGILGWRRIRGTLSRAEP